MKRPKRVTKTKHARPTSVCWPVEYMRAWSEDGHSISASGKRHNVFFNIHYPRSQFDVWLLKGRISLKVPRIRQLSLCLCEFLSFSPSG